MLYINEWKAKNREKKKKIHWKKEVEEDKGKHLLVDKGRKKREREGTELMILSFCNNRTWTKGLISSYLCASHSCPFLFSNFCHLAGPTKHKQKINKYIYNPLRRTWSSCKSPVTPNKTDIINIPHQVNETRVFKLSSRFLEKRAFE